MKRRFGWGDRRHELLIEEGQDRQRFTAVLDGQEHPLTVLGQDRRGATLRLGGRVIRVDLVGPDGQGYFRGSLDGRPFRLLDLDAQVEEFPEVDSGGAQGQDAELRAPMPGRVVSVLAENGRTIAAGRGVVVIEAMKMEHTVVAPCDGLVQGLRVAAGEQVGPGQILAVIQVDKGPSGPS